jgi:hypothetical protein
MSDRASSEPETVRAGGNGDIDHPSRAGGAKRPRRA